MRLLNSWGSTSMSDIDVAYAIRALADAVEKHAKRTNYVLNVTIDKDTDVEMVIAKINKIVGYRNQTYVR